jgi:hypothetical protein
MTEKFLLQFGFESLRDLPDLEKLEDAGGFSVRRAGMSPDERGLSWKARLAKRPSTTRRVLLPTSQAYWGYGDSAFYPARVQ